MNNTFNFNRFSLLLKRQWQEFGKIYLVTLFVVTGIIVACYAFNMPEKERYGRESMYPTQVLNLREPLFLIVGFFFITIVSSTYFAMLGQKPRAIIELMVPGSVLEKFLAGVLYTAALSTLSYLIIFYITDQAFVSYLDKEFGHLTLLSQREGEPNFKSFPGFFDLNRGIQTAPFYVLPFLVSSLFLLGSIYFNRFHYIKTAVSVMIISGAISFLIFKAAEFLFEGKVRVSDENSWFDLWTTNQVVAAMISLLVACTVVLWVTGYIRLKEKEV